MQRLCAARDLPVVTQQFTNFRFLSFSKQIFFFPFVVCRRKTNCASSDWILGDRERKRTKKKMKNQKTRHNLILYLFRVTPRIWPFPKMHTRNRMVWMWMRQGNRRCTIRWLIITNDWLETRMKSNWKIPKNIFSLVIRIPFKHDTRVEILLQRSRYIRD